MKDYLLCERLVALTTAFRGPGSVVGIATGYGKTQQKLKKSKKKNILTEIEPLQLAF